MKAIVGLFAIFVMLGVAGLKFAAFFKNPNPVPPPSLSVVPKQTPGPSPGPGVPVPAVLAAASHATSAPTPRPPYDLRSETFLACVPGVLRTTEREYTEGEMCSLGMVVAIRGKCAKIEQPDRRVMYVVADQVHGDSFRPQSVLPQAVTPLATPAAQTAVQAAIAAVPSEDPGLRRSSLAESEKARMSRNIRASTRTQPALASAEN